MKRGFVTENHTVVHCDLCGEIYTENGSESICFDSEQQAASYLMTGAARRVGWVYDGDRIWCDGCIAADFCDRNGHRFPEVRPSLKRLLDGSAPARACSRCGVLDSEVPS
ncbi:hypothetical protein [Nocardia sp. NPDC057030]|uniref:hypothetical protein n=1 Tax=unclassified Nocardia TaxID=2637762 RepID=UPI00363FA010